MKMHKYSNKTTSCEIKSGEASLIYLIIRYDFVTFYFFVFPLFSFKII